MEPKSHPCDFSQLPPHVIGQIFNHLNFRQRLNAARTCKSWYFGSCDPIIWKNTLVRIGHKTNRLEQFHRPFGMLQLQRVNFNAFDYYKEFFAKFGQYIREVEFYYCELTLSQLFDCLIYLTNLKTLKIQVRDKIFSNEVKLNDSDRVTIKTNLYWVKHFYIALDIPDAGGLWFILSSMPNLKTLHFGITDYCYSFVFQNLFDYFNMFEKVNLKHLQLSTLYGTTSTDFMNSFAKMKQHFAIEKLTLGSFQSEKYGIEYYDEKFEYFCKKLANVRVLTMWSPGDNQLHDICRYMTKLVWLNLHGMRNKKISDIGNLCHLEKLKLHFSYEYLQDATNEEQLLTMFARLGNLNDLQLNIRISENILNAICRSCHKLVRLELFVMHTNCYVAIFKYLIHLKYLNLSFWDNFNDEFSVDHNITNLRELEVLEISRFAPGMTLELIEKLPNLEQSCLLEIKTKLKPGYVDPKMEETYDMMACLFDS